MITSLKALSIQSLCFLTGVTEVNQIIQILLTSNMFVGGMTTFILDNIVPGQWKQHWCKLVQFNNFSLRLLLGPHNHQIARCLFFWRTPKIACLMYRITITMVLTVTGTKAERGILTYRGADAPDHTDEDYIDQLDKAYGWPYVSQWMRRHKGFFRYVPFLPP